MSERRAELARLRRQRGLTQEQFAEHVGTDVSTVSRWKRGEQTPNLDVRHRIAGALACSLDELDRLLEGRVADAPAPDLPAPTGPARDIGGLDLEALLEFWRQHWHVQVRADNLLGPRLALHEVLAQLEVAQSVLAAITGSDWRRVAAWAASYAESASWLYENLADSAAARTWVHHARRWAQAAGDTAMTAWTNYRRSQLALSNGDADHALGLAQPDTASLPPVMVAAFAVHHGLCHATLGEEHAALERLDVAHQYASNDRTGDAADGHGSFATPEYVELHRAWPHTLLGRPAQALPVFEQHLTSLPAAYRRDRSLALARYAQALLECGRIDQAADYAHQAWSLALDTGTVRTREHVHALATQLHGHRRTPEVADLLDQLHDHQHA